VYGVLPGLDPRSLVLVSDGDTIAAGGSLARTSASGTQTLIGFPADALPSTEPIDRRITFRALTDQREQRRHLVGQLIHAVDESGICRGTDIHRGASAVYNDEGRLIR
jgi:hypothetical protein